MSTALPSLPFALMGSSKFELKEMSTIEKLTSRQWQFCQKYLSRAACSVFRGGWTSQRALLLRQLLSLWDFVGSGYIQLLQCELILKTCCQPCEVACRNSSASSSTCDYDPISAA